MLSFKIINEENKEEVLDLLLTRMPEADGEYICFIDADLQQRPETVREMVQILDGASLYCTLQILGGEVVVCFFFFFFFLVALHVGS